MRLYRIWVLKFVKVLVLFEILVAILNYSVDPLWCFGNVDKHTAKAIIIDQRLQKTNLLAFGPSGYDTLILGSSRTEPINGLDFPGRKAFNYALPAIYPDEYPGYIDFFKKHNQRTFNQIYLGLDFFGSSSRKPVVNKPPNYYHSQSAARGYRFTSLLSPDPLWKYLKERRNSDYYYRYDRRYNILIPRDMTAAERQRFIDRRLLIFKEHFYADGVYRYNDKLVEMMTAITDENKGVRIQAFTSPVSRLLFEQMVRQGRYEDYEHWLRDIVRVFGSVINFMTINTVTSEMSNFYDADHFYPPVGTLVAHRLCGIADPAVPADFGDYVTDQNLESYLSLMRQHVTVVYGRSVLEKSQKGGAN
jgi:hypothetical protein